MSDIEDWIERQIESGYSAGEIKEAMSKSGRSPDLVDEIIGKHGKSHNSFPWKLGLAVFSVFAFILFAYFTFSPITMGFSGATVVREIEESELLPGGGSDIHLYVEGEYGEMEIRENVPEGMRVPDEGQGSFDREEGTINWKLDGESVVTYRVGAPGASTGTFNFTGTYIHDGSPKVVEGDERIEVRW